ncbi:hypothetical protein BD626DRAFT_389552, partial [Schizophyllum amplum]
LREAIAKYCRGNIEAWPRALPLALFADRITVSRVTGFSPYQLLHGSDPVLSLDLAEVMFLAPEFRVGMSTSDLLAARMKQLERHPHELRKAAQSLWKARFHSKAQFDLKFERRFQRKLVTHAYREGQMVLLRNSSLEKSVAATAKIVPRYLGPYQIVRRNKGGAYILQEMDGTVLARGVAPRRLLPY